MTLGEGDLILLNSAYIKLNELLKQKYLHNNKAIFKSIDFGDNDINLTTQNSGN